MQDERRVFPRIGIAVVSVVLLVFVAPIGCMVGSVLFDIHKSNRERRHLLYETDHAALLAACREVMAKRHDYILFAGDRDLESFDLDPEHPDLPSVIRDLGLGYMIAEDDRLVIELHGGMDHYGVVALSDERAKDPRSILPGDIELLPGLFYHDELLTPLSAKGRKWMEKLKSMKPRNIPEPAWWNASPIHPSPARTPTPVFPESSRVWKVD